MPLLDKAGLERFYLGLKNKFSALGHTHTKSEITDFAHTHTKSEITDFSHTHDDRYYTESEIDSKVSTLNTAINGKAASSHTHDDRYYTEAEIDSKVSTLNTAINGKAASSHTHDDRYYTESEINSKLSLIPLYETMGLTISIATHGAVNYFTLPTIPAAGQMKTYRISGGSVTNPSTSAWRYCDIGISLPSSGTYLLLGKSGSLTATYSGTSVTLDVSSRWANTYNGSSCLEVGKGATATVTGTAYITLVRIA